MIKLCETHGLPTKARKDGNGRFCIKCVDTKARHTQGWRPTKGMKK